MVQKKKPKKGLMKCMRGDWGLAYLLFFSVAIISETSQSNYDWIIPCAIIIEVDNQLQFNHEIEP